VGKNVGDENNSHKKALKNQGFILHVWRERCPPDPIPCKATALRFI